MKYHLGTNLGYTPFCYETYGYDDEKSTTIPCYSSERLVEPDYWCLNCLKIWFDIHGKEYPNVPLRRCIVETPKIIKGDCNATCDRSL